MNLMNADAFQDNSFFRSPFSIVPLNIILRPELIEEKKILDKHINKLKQTGELARIIKSHLILK